VSNGPPTSAESLSFERRGEDFVLVRIDERGKRSEIILSESNLLFLPRIVQETIHKILAERSSKTMKERGASPIVAVPVVRVQLNTDIHRSEILLTMYDRFGNESGFALPFEVAQPLSSRLPARVAEIEKAKPKVKPS
jgi:hypothetical protein